MPPALGGVWAAAVTKANPHQLEAETMDTMHTNADVLTKVDKLM